MKLRMNMQKINNDIEYFKQSLFLEPFENNDKTKYQTKTNRESDRKNNFRRSSGNSNLNDDRRMLKYGKDQSINSYTESKNEATSRKEIGLINSEPQ
jgi:hypothetical protein